MWLSGYDVWSIIVSRLKQIRKYNYMLNDEEVKSSLRNVMIG